MDLKGFEAINQALASADVEATVTPEPADGEDVRFVTVETATDVQPARVLNALRNANLMYYDGPKDAVMTYDPELTPVGVEPGSITLEDMNDANRRMWR
jgi:hypothetical protein